MNKIIGLAVLLFFLSGCVRDNDAIYYPVGNVDVERGGPALEAGKGDLIARSYNTEDYVLDTLAQYPGDPTVVGLYFYPNKVVDVAKHIQPSPRGELEITTVNQEFLNDHQLKVQLLGRGFAWLDTGTHDSLSEASTFIEVIEKRQGLKVACLEGIALRHGWITADKMRELAKPMLKNQYGQYLLKVINELGLE